MIHNIKEAQDFDSWMKDTVKNVFYANRSRMMSAFEKIEALKFNPLN